MPDVTRWYGTFEQVAADGRTAPTVVMDIADFVFAKPRAEFEKSLNFDLDSIRRDCLRLYELKNRVPTETSEIRS